MASYFDRYSRNWLKIVITVYFLQNPSFLTTLKYKVFLS
jgi:hypothetical protein